MMERRRRELLHYCEWVKDCVAEILQVEGPGHNAVNLRGPRMRRRIGHQDDAGKRVQCFPVVYGGFDLVFGEMGSKGNGIETLGGQEVGSSFNGLDDGDLVAFDGKLLFDELGNEIVVLDKQNSPTSAGGHILYYRQKGAGA